jgi:hypothetical protein
VQCAAVTASRGPTRVAPQIGCEVPPVRR